MVNEPMISWTNNQAAVRQLFQRSYSNQGHTLTADDFRQISNDQTNFRSMVLSQLELDGRLAYKGVSDIKVSLVRSFKEMQDGRCKLKMAPIQVKLEGKTLGSTLIT